jgi:hypothetical protein
MAQQTKHLRVKTEFDNPLRDRRRRDTLHLKTIPVGTRLTVARTEFPGEWAFDEIKIHPSSRKFIKDDSECITIFKRQTRDPDYQKPFLDFFARLTENSEEVAPSTFDWLRENNINQKKVLEALIDSGRITKEEVLAVQQKLDD